MFEVGVGLRQGCVMSPWLFNLFLDSVVSDMDGSGKGTNINLNGSNWEVSVLLFADNTLLIADSKEKLRDFVNQFENICQEKGLKINPAKSKVMKISPLETSPVNADGDSRSGLDMIKVWEKSIKVYSL